MDRRHPIPSNRRPESLPLLRRASSKSAISNQLSQTQKHDCYFQHAADWYPGTCVSTVDSRPFTTPPLSSSDGLPDYVWDHFQQSLPMSTYLIAFVISDFECLKNGTFSVWARRSAVSQTKYSLQIGPQILEFYENFFGIKYPLPKVDMIGLPDFSAGAMENWGLITYR